MKKGFEVYIADNYSRSKRDRYVESIFKKPNVHEIEINLCNKNEYIKLPKEVDYIYHLAALNGTQNFYESPFDVLVNYTQPTIELLNYYSKSLKLKRFIYAGSSEAYATSVSVFNWEVPTKENVPLGVADPTNVRWSYGGSKLYGELAVIAASAQFNIYFTILRYHNIYGPRMGDKHVIPDFLIRAKRGRYKLYGHQNTRSFIYVDDAVSATILCAESENTKNEILNIGSRVEITMFDLAKKIMKLLDVEGNIICDDPPKGSVQRRVPDITKVCKLTGFSPKVSLEDGLAKTIKFDLKNS